MGIVNDVVNMLDFDREHIETDESTKSKIELIIANGKQHLRDKLNCCCLIESYLNFGRIKR